MSPASTPRSGWREQALCARPDMAAYRDAFFAHPTDTDTTALAKRICAACPVREACLQAALAEEGGRGHHDRFGIRGGLGPRGRRNRYEAARRARRKAAA